MQQKITMYLITKNKIIVGQSILIEEIRIKIQVRKNQVQKARDHNIQMIRTKKMLIKTNKVKSKQKKMNQI